MSFSTNIPQVTNLLATSKLQLRANFQAINEAFTENHVTLTEGNDSIGFHNEFTLRPQSVDPTLFTNQCALYNKLVSGVPQLFFRSGVSTPIQWSNSNVSTADNDNCYSFMAGPFTIFVGIIRNCLPVDSKTFSQVTTLLSASLGTVGKANPNSRSINAIPVSLVGNVLNIRYDPVVLKPPATTQVVYYTVIGV